jgi:hypothetical protein
MKRIGIMFLAGAMLLGAMASYALAQKTSLTDYKAQLEAALGGKIITVQKTTRTPASSLTQVLNFTVDRGAGRTEVVPVQVVFVKSGGGYAVQSMYVISTSSALAVRRMTQLPAPGPTSGGGGGGGTGTNPPALNRVKQCNDMCFADFAGGVVDFARAEACYFACLLGLPLPPK